MKKKIFISLLFLISLVVLAGGCGSGHSNIPVTVDTEVNTALKGAWTAPAKGSATITSNNDDSNELEEITKAFGEIPEDVLKQYQEAQANKTTTTITAPVTRTMALFEDCNLSGTSGTVKLTAVIIVSGDTTYLPIFFNGVKLSTQRNSTNSWTATTPDGGTLSINMSSEEKMNLSGKIKYLDYNCEFSTAIEKNEGNSINPETILEGTWSLDGTQSGGALSDGSKVFASVVPAMASMSFNKNQTSAMTLSAASSHISLVKNSAGVDDLLSLLHSVKPASEAKLSQISDSVYKLTDSDGNESIIFVENTDEIFVIKNESEDNIVETSVFLPLKKADWDIETLLKKNWVASEGDGGGWTLINSNVLDEANASNILLSFTLKNASLNFSGVTVNDDGTITASMQVNASLPVNNEIFKTLLTEAQRTMTVNESGTVTMTKSGNSCRFTNDGDIYNLSFISETELILSVETGKEGEGVGEFIIKFNAN